MKQRCYNPNSTQYQNYGGKGIAICQEWLDDFMNFYNWAMNNGYDETLTIDRIDSNENYCPKNCRWITRSDNSSKANRERYIAKNTTTKKLSISQKSPYNIEYNINIEENPILKIMLQNGREIDRINGSHHVFRHNVKKGTVTVPHPRKDIPIKTAKSILSQAGLSLE